ncbi:MAG: hypothetical protein JSV08_06715 [Acidobacteriota bacterium]|nr:MAG: hypothetical protein JSV08_06715 [Acidobacteriota bacterium]
MRKLLFTTLAVIAVAAVLAPQAEAAVLQFGVYDPVTGQNATDHGGNHTDIMYYPGAPVTGGALESCFTGTPYPVAGGLADGGLGCRAPGVFLLGTTSGNLVDSPINPDPAGAGTEYVIASTYLTNAPGAWAPGACYPHAAVNGTPCVQQFLNIVYNSFQTTDAAAATADLGGGFNPATIVPVGQPVGPNSGKAPLGGGAYYPHVVIPSGILPGPTPGGGFFPTPNVLVPGPVTGNPVIGVQLYRSTTAFASCVPPDFALADLGNLSGSGPTVRWDGTGMDGDKMGVVGGEFYFNDITQNADAPLNYIAVPMLVSDLANPFGVSLFFEGSWGPTGQPGDAFGLPIPATVVSFDADFDPRTGKVTLNWKSAAEQDLSGYNVWRQLSLSGRPVGDKVLVGFVGAAGGPAEYSLTDEPDLSKLGRLARGRPIDADYSLEEVNADGTTNVIKTTSVQVTKSSGRRSR